MAFPQALDQLPVGDDEGGPASAFRSGEIGIEAVREAIEHLEPDSPLRSALEVLQHQQRLSQMLFVPLLAAGRAVGLMCLCYPEGHKVPTDDVKSLETARNAIGVAIDHALLYQANQQRAEELASANQELKSLDQMKNDFISLVGHELRTPLAGILGYAEFLLDEDLSPEESREFAATIHRESERLTRMVNAVLDLNKMEAGRIEYRKVAEDFNDIVRAAATSMEAAAGRRNQRLRLALAPGPMTAEFDPDRIQQVVLNLLSNAVKFSPENSEIEVGTRTDDGSVIAWVRDQGMGIGPEDISRVFEKFVQADHGSKRLEGTGLGLPICKGIVEGGHAGQMWAESPGPGQGATFYFRIPRHAADASAHR
jgi:signal transduction histidine kinase